MLHKLWGYRCAKSPSSYSPPLTPLISLFVFSVSLLEIWLHRELDITLYVGFTLTCWQFFVKCRIDASNGNKNKFWPRYLFHSASLLQWMKSYAHLYKKYITPSHNSLSAQVLESNRKHYHASNSNKYILFLYYHRVQSAMITALWLVVLNVRYVSWIENWTTSDCKRLPSAYTDAQGSITTVSIRI